MRRIVSRDRAVAVVGFVVVLCGACGDSGSVEMDAEGLRHTQVLDNAVRIAISNSTLVLAAEHFESVFDFNTGEEYLERGALRVFERSGDAWRETAFLTHLAAGLGPQLHEGVAVDGDTIVAPGGRNSVVVFEKRDDRWTTADVVEVEFSLFEPEIVVRGDTAIVFKPGVGTDAVVLRRTASGWAKAGEVVSASSEGLPDSVLSVPDVDFDGETLVLGLASRDAVYVYERRGDSFVETQMLEPEPRGDHAWFGAAVAVSGDRMAVAATPDGAGEVTVYTRDEDGWTPTGQTIPFEPGDEDLANGLALQGSRLLVGDPGDTSLHPGVNPLTGAGTTADKVGAANLFEEVNGVWEKRYELRSSAPSRYIHFGTFVALTDDQALVSGRAVHPMHVWSFETTAREPTSRLKAP